MDSRFLTLCAVSQVRSRYDHTRIHGLHRRPYIKFHTEKESPYESHPRIYQARRFYLEAKDDGLCVLFAAMGEICLLPGTKRENISVSLARISHTARVNISITRLDKYRVRQSARLCLRNMRRIEQT